MMGLKRSRNYGKMAKKSLSKPMKKVVKKAVTRAKVNNIKKIVKSVLRRTNELKIAQQTFLADNVDVAGSGLFYDGAANLRGWCSGPSNAAGIIPAVPSGTGEASKIGNKITPKNLILKYFLTALPTDEATSAQIGNPYKGIPFRVRVIVFRHKYSIDDFSQANILQNGNATNSFGSSMDNFFRPYNRDEYTVVYSKSIKMAACKHVTAAGVITTENVPNGSLSFYAGTAKIPLPKVLTYNDGIDIPSNQNYFMAVALCNEDSTVVLQGLHRRVRLNAETNMTYYDD